MPTTLVTGPSDEPVSVTELKDHLRITETDEDALLAGFIASARAHTEVVLKRALITQTWDYFLDGFPSVFEVPKAPLQSVTSISYVDGDGASQTVATSIYTVDTDSDPGRIYLAYGQTWPTPRSQYKAVTVRFVAGYGDAADDVPVQIRHAILMLAGHLEKNREATSDLNVPIVDVPIGYHALLAPFRVVRF